MLHAARGSLLLLDPQTGELWSKQAERAVGIEIRFLSTAGLARDVVRTGQGLVVSTLMPTPNNSITWCLALGYWSARSLATAHVSS